MNSTQLQKDFPEVYKDFFGKNDLVVSGCFCMPWGYEGLFHQSNFIISKSKIPLKCYVWIQKNNLGDILLADIICPENDLSFKATPFWKVIKEEATIKEKILKIAKDLWILGTGLTVTILSELPRWHSFWFSDTSFSVLAAAIYTLAWKWESFQNPSINPEAQRLAWELSLQARYWNTIGQWIENTFSSSSSPMFKLSQIFEAWKEPKEITLEVKHHHFSTGTEISSSKQINRETPLDYWVIFTGIETNSKQIEESGNASIKEPDNLKVFIKRLFPGLESGYFFDEFLRDDIWIDSCKNLLSIQSIRTAYLLDELYKSWLDIPRIDEFIDHLNNQAKILSSISWENHFAEQFASLFRKHTKTPIEKLGLLPIYSTKFWWGLIFVLKPWMSRHTLENSLDEIRLSYPDARLDYCSYIDWESSDWILIEQHISKSLYGRHLSFDQLIYRNTHGESYIGTSEEIYERESEGVLIDLTTKKIIIWWKKLTSKDIPAQSTTSEIIAMLMDNLWRDVSNQDLPVSSYSSSKNDMLGKIILPIMKMIRDEYKEDLAISCKGGIWDFHLHLDANRIRLGVIRKL